MAARGVLRTVEGGRLMFWCPGCDEAHVIGPSWTFNGNFDRPTFQPSVLVTGVQKITDEEYDRVMAGEKIEPRPLRCHSFVTDGQIQFLSDCTHARAGQTIALRAFDEDQEL
ncbi:ammonia monooxygenase [Mesorhizobium sp. M4A.F.Ca.ET.020.02.1.1]|uniref:DUF6527 family protein n=1 Tax=Mesorhizobium sp. M4A.F.Ca.ET.020.02.1.1 TaxID=2496652 RepID=UPI000FD366C9|nr:DUF6527 family protein [Mesorhizobium sp. M4A.F.Ca.ET.020.02.1.1]RVD39051.1 ammonia monooxygenase [Mesorhizobium sp. M4A.F.Ca.ET.020.02.1.1]